MKQEKKNYFLLLIITYYNDFLTFHTYFEKDIFKLPSQILKIKMVWSYFFFFFV